MGSAQSDELTEVAPPYKEVMTPEQLVEIVGVWGIYPTREEAEAALQEGVLEMGEGAIPPGVELLPYHGVRFVFAPHGVKVSTPSDWTRVGRDYREGTTRYIFVQRTEVPQRVEDQWFSTRLMNYPDYEEVHSADRVLGFLSAPFIPVKSPSDPPYGEWEYRVALGGLETIPEGWEVWRSVVLDPVSCPAHPEFDRIGLCEWCGESMQARTGEIDVGYVVELRRLKLHTERAHGLWWSLQGYESHPEPEAHVWGVVEELQEIFPGIAWQWDQGCTWEGRAWPQDFPEWAEVAQVPQGHWTSEWKVDWKPWYIIRELARLPAIITIHGGGSSWSIIWRGRPDELEHAQPAVGYPHGSLKGLILGIPAVYIPGVYVPEAPPAKAEWLDNWYIIQDILLHDGDVTIYPDMYVQGYISNDSQFLHFASQGWYRSPSTGRITAKGLPPWLKVVGSV